VQSECALRNVAAPAMPPSGLGSLQGPGGRDLWGRGWRRWSHGAGDRAPRWEVKANQRVRPFSQKMLRREAPFRFLIAPSLPFATSAGERFDSFSMSRGKVDYFFTGGTLTENQSELNHPK